MVVNDEEKFFFLTRDKKELYALIGAGLNLSQSPPEKLKKNVGSILISESGLIYRIIEIERNGLFGQSIIQKLISFFAGAYKIKTKIVQEDMSFESMKEILLDYLEFDLHSNNPTFDYLLSNQLDTLNRVKESSNINDIFEAVRFPCVEDCMDSI